jgi:uncharacterized protein YktB (UPF0637 family)
VLIEEYDSLSVPEQFVFGGLYVWTQVHGIPELYRKQDVVDDLTQRVGKVKEVQLTVSKTILRRKLRSKPHPTRGCRCYSKRL